MTTRTRYANPDSVEGLPMSIVPAVIGLQACEDHIGYEDGKVDLYSIFNGVRAPHSFPHVLGRFCLFAQLINGLGELPFHFEIRHAVTDTLIYVTATKRLRFLTRTSKMQLVMSFQDSELP